MDTVASNPLGAACPRWCDPASSDHSREGIVFHGTSGTPATFIVGQYDDEDIVREHELHVSLANHEWNLETADEWRTTAAELRRIAADAARVASWLEANRNPMATGA